MGAGGVARVDSSSEGSMFSIDGIVSEVTKYKNRPTVVSVFLPNGSYLTNVAWSGGYIDPETKNLHGDYIPPVIGQKVMIAFSDGDTRSPYVSAILFRGGLSDEADLYVDFPNKAGIEKDSILRSHRTGGKQHFYTDTIETGYENGAKQTIQKESVVTSVETGFIETRVKDGGGQSVTKESVTTGLLDGDSYKPKSQILQDASGITLGAGGPSGAQPVAVVNDNYVLTALGLQAILPAPTRTGPFQQVVKA